MAQYTANWTKLHIVNLNLPGMPPHDVNILNEDIPDPEPSPGQINFT